MELSGGVVVSPLAVPVDGGVLGPGSSLVVGATVTAAFAVVVAIVVGEAVAELAASSVDIAVLLNEALEGTGPIDGVVTGFVGECGSVAVAVVVDLSKATRPWRKSVSVCVLVDGWLLCLSRCDQRNVGRTYMEERRVWMMIECVIVVSGRRGATAQTDHAATTHTHIHR